MPKVRIALIAIIILFSTCVRANTSLRQLTIENGLSGMTAVDAAEDPGGMLWIATSNGVSLFNGKSVKQYPLPKSAQGFANRCFDIDIDSHGDVWVGTIVGVYRLRRYDNWFVRVAEHIDNVESLACAGSDVYVGNRSGLYRIGKNGDVK